MRSLLVAILLFPCCLLISACNRSTPVPNAAKQAQQSDASTSQAEDDSGLLSADVDEQQADGIIELDSVASRKDQGLLADEIKLSDQKGTWQTEAFHESIKPRLKNLGQIIGSREWEKVDAGLLADQFACSDLRPDKKRMSSVFKDENVVVYRPSSESPFSLAHEGAAGFVASLRQLATPFDPKTKIVVNFKVYKVDVRHDAAESEMHVDTDGVGENGGVEQNMVLTAGWRRVGEDDWKLSSVTLKQFEEVHYRRTQDVKLFSDCTESVLAGNTCFEDQFLRGIDHWRLRLEERFGVDSVSLTGLAVGDVNGDGLDDVYFCDVGGLPNRLFVQQPDGTAVDVSVKSGVDWLDRSRGALLVDLDNDGDQDLAVSLGSSLLLMENDGTGKFSARARLHPQPTAQSLSAVDYDNDGRLDIYVCSYGNSLETFADSQTPMPWHDANNGASNTMFQNEGDWKFSDVTSKVGLDQNNRRYSYAASWEDFDNDGDQDLYVANDFGRNNLFVNQGGRFRDVARERGVEDKSLGMSADWSDYDNDGRMDLYVGNMFSGAGNRVTFQKRFMSGSSAEVIGDFRHSARGNTLFRQIESGSFGDVSLSAGVTLGRWSWSSLFADINNDGWQDLIVTNGHVTGVETDDL